MLLKVDLPSSRKSWRILKPFDDCECFCGDCKISQTKISTVQAKIKGSTKNGVCKSTVRVQNQLPAVAWNVDSGTFLLLAYLLLLYVRSWVIRGCG